MLSTLQSLLNELSNDIKTTIERAFEKMENIKWKSSEEEALYRLEQCKIYLSHYGNITKATTYLNTAINLLGLDYSLIGKLKYYYKFILF